MRQVLMERCISKLSSPRLILISVQAAGADLIPQTTPHDQCASTDGKKVVAHGSGKETRAS